MTLEAEIQNGRLPDDALGYACFWDGLLMEREGYNKADHFWRITTQERAGDTLRLSARLRVSRDMWGTGGGVGATQSTLRPGKRG